MELAVDDANVENENIGGVLEAAGRGLGLKQIVADIVITVES